MKQRGLTGQVKQKLIEKSIQRKLKQNALPQSPGINVFSRNGAVDFEEFTRFEQHPAHKQIEYLRQGSAQLELEDPFFRSHQGVAGATTQIAGKNYINFASYNYLDYSGDSRVNQAVIEATQHYGSSVSASRMVSGERPIHQELEEAIANLYQVDSALAFVSGHATNVTVIGFLMQPGDLILHDELIHNSAMLGAQLSGAKRIAYRHNDTEHLANLLEQHRHQFKRVLILTEGLFSMDGDYPDLPRMVSLKQQHYAWLMVDEAHSLGVLGATGKGLAEHFQLSAKSVDIWMGTLSKTLSGCGGYIAGNQALIDILRYLCPGFLYSVGMPAGIAAAAITSLKLMQQEPWRTKQLAENAYLFKQKLHEVGFDTGKSQGKGLVPLITGSSVAATRLSSELFNAEINVQPVLYPAVPEKMARLRFFISAAHTKDQLQYTVDTLIKCAGKCL